MNSLWHGDGLTDSHRQAAMKPTEGNAYFSLDRSNREHTHGSALIALIAAILLFSVLAAALIPMISSSGEQAALSSLGDKAYMLAEAGYRLARNHYNNPGMGITQNQALEALDGGNFTLSGGQGTFRLALYSYFYPIPTAANGTNTFTANPPGRLPINSALHDDNVTIQNGSLLSIAGQIYTIISPVTPSSADDNVTITLNQNLVGIPAGASAYPAAQTTQTALARGGNLTYNSASQGAMFPLRNGRINVKGYPNPLTYGYNDRGHHQFVNVRDPMDQIANYTFSPNANIVLTKFARLNSTGVVSGGTLATQREVTYYLSADSEEEEKVSVGLNDFQRVEPSTTATALINPGGNEALAITRADNQTSLVKLDSTVSGAALNRGRRGSGGYLSYDAQVKVGFYTGNPVATPLADAPIGIIPSAVTPVGAGLNFRLSNATSNTNYNGYGLSFVRGDATLPPGNVPAGLEDQPLIVLWQQTDNGATRSWLAYKQLQPRLYPVLPDKFDDVISTWTQTNARWNIDNTGRDGSPTWHYSSTGGATLQSPVITLSSPVAPSPMCDGAPTITLTFWARENIDLLVSPYREARISYNGGFFGEFTPIKTTIVENGWSLYTYDLSSHTGQTIQIQFFVSSSGSFPVEWRIDDVQIYYQSCQWPVQNSTLLVRLKEATVVRFTNGGPQEILKGDRVYGQTSGTIGVVIQPPLRESGDWGTSSAAGTLLLNNVSVNTTGFQTGEDLRVVGRTSGIGAVVASDPNVSCPQNNGNCKVNIIKAFFASQAGSGTPSGDPMDPDTRPYPRRAPGERLSWPPDEDDNWTTAEDYFRLVKWDAVNSANVVGLHSLSFRDGAGNLIEDAVIHSYHTDLQSPPLGQPAVTELGLHAYGAGADNVYYDDFGLRLLFSPGSLSLFNAALQQ
jgi:hypothetical protein